MRASFYFCALFLLNQSVEKRVCIIVKSMFYSYLQYFILYAFIHHVKGKSVPLQARSGPEGSRKLRFPDYMTTVQDGGKVVSLKHRPPLPPGNTPGTHFC